MVTFSHNPSEYNGFKIVIGGNTLSVEAIQDLQDRAERGGPGGQPGLREHADILSAYLDAEMSRRTAPPPMNMVVDCGKGVAGITVPQGWSAWGMKRFNCCRALNMSFKLVTRYEGQNKRALQRIRTRFEEAIQEAIQSVG